MTFREYIATLKTLMRVPLECSPRIVWKLLYNFCWRNLRNMSRFERRQAKGEPFFPAFVMISLTESCNLSCSGCWVSRGGRKSLTPEQVNGVIEQSKRNGSYFFGLLGGEPLMYPGLMEIIAAHPDCYFQVFTNGTLLTEEVARRFRELGNVTPLISIEGLEEESDSRRGKSEVFNRSLAGVRACKKAKLMFGVAASICRSNYSDLVNRRYLERIAAEGAHYIWYYIYRPVGAEPNPENALTKEQVASLRRFIVEQRKDAPLFIIETYWDEKGRALCPGAMGMSHHLSPAGALEFCPPLQLAKDFLNADASNLTQLFRDSAFLDGLRKMTAETSRGCILLENPSKLADFLVKEGAFDTTSRQTVMEELKKMTPCAGHNMPAGEEIPEENAIYRYIKKHYFFGFGAYG